MAGELPVAVVQLHDQDLDLPIIKMREIVIQDIGETHAPASFLRIQDIGLATFPMTTSGKVRKAELRDRVLQHVQEQRHCTNGPPAVEEDTLCRIFAFLLGQTPETLPREKPLEEMADSINLLRLVAHVRRDMSKEITTADVVGSTNIKTLGERLSKLEVLRRPEGMASIRPRDGPPTVHDMVHAHGDERRATRTQQVTDEVLHPLGMSWQKDVEDAFPVSGMALKHLTNTRRHGSTLRVSFVARTVGVSRLSWAIKESLKQWAPFRFISVWFDENVRLYVVLRLDSNWSKLTILDHPDVDEPQDLCRIDLPKEKVSIQAPGPLIRIIVARVRSTGTAGAVVM